MRVIIVDDEYPSRKELRYFIETYTDMDIVGEFDNGLDVLNFIQENILDAIFLDINIPKLDGMLLAKTIDKFEKKPQMVFITAYDNYAVEAFNLEIFDYILKPYSDERIISMLNKLGNVGHKKNYKDITEYQKISNKISLWKNDKIHIVDVNDIYYCEARERYTRIFTENEKYEIRKGISEIEKTINCHNFFRSHRSYLVNLEKIEEIIPWFNNTYVLKLNKGKYEVTVSRSRVQLFRQLMDI